MKKACVATAIAAAAAFATASAAASPGDLYVAEFGANQVTRVKPATGDTRTVRDGGPMATASYLAFEPDGSLVVTDEDRPGVFRIDPRTGKTRKIGGEGLSGPYGVARAATGRLVFADFSLGAVLSMNPRTGAYVPLAAGGFISVPYGVAVSPAGHTFVTDAGGEVLRIARNGSRRTIAESPDLSAPWSIARAPDGTLFVGDQGANQVLRVNPDSGSVTPVAPVEYPLGIAVAPSGALFVTSYEAGEVVRINPGGGAPQTVATDLSEPVGIAIEPPRCFGRTATIPGSTKRDRLQASRFADVIAGLGGNDLLGAGAGADRVCGGPANDRIRATKGRNRVDCGPGKRDVAIVNAKTKVRGCERVKRR